MSIVIMIILLLAIIGFLFGLILAFANKKLAVELNPLIYEVEDILPKGQCGACGYAGCQAYAEAVVLNKDVLPNLCIPGKLEVAKKIEELTGKKSKEIEKKIAYVQCSNPINIAQKKFEYHGIKDCVAASILHLGPKNCQYGCIGFGTCVNHCIFNAIKLNKEGLPVVNSERCTGCGKCATVCPKKIIHMISVKSHVEVLCSSNDKGAIARKHCNFACLGCGICSKSCPHNAIEICNNLAVVNSSICIEKCTRSTCIEKCPTGAIKIRQNKCN